MLLWREQMNHCYRTLVCKEVNMLDNNLGIEPEEISEGHIYKRNSDIYI